MRSCLRFSHLPEVMAAVAAVATLAQNAAADPPACNSLAHPVYITGSSALESAIGGVAQTLETAASPVTVIYVSQGSCVGVAAMSVAPGDPTNTLTPGTLIADTFDPTTGAKTSPGCTLDPGGVSADIGASDVYASTCGATVAANAHDFHTFNQVMQFAVPIGTGGSDATAITAEAAYMVFGFGAAAGKQITPWNDPSVIFERGSGSGTQAMLGVAINVPGAKWPAAPDGTGSGPYTEGSGGTLESKLAGTISGTKGKAAIGILAADVTAAHPNDVRPLAFQAYGQTCAFLPDSKQGSFDKANVRDGHYAVWGPEHLYTFVGTDGKAVNPDAQVVLDVLTGATTLTTFDFLNYEATHGVVPDCAMKVSRTTEVGQLASYQPTGDCTCAYVKDATGTAPSDCKTCTTANGTVDSTHCSAGRNVCNYGFCEVK
ncbi:MAG TPA: hypothetical protein VH142_13655 [Polyangiaceae bacterium]|nr:hypothetical protein [Polyangiaceae bacterium]